MSATGTVLRGRRAAEALMVDACTITRGGAGTATFDTTTGRYTDPSDSSVYTGKCRVKGNARFDKIVEAGEQPVTLYRFTVSVPISSTAFHVDDLVTITASALDPALVGLVLRVREPEFGSQITARRLGCEVNAG